MRLGRLQIPKISWLWVLGSLNLACVIHIVTVLALPYIAERDAWARLGDVAPEFNKMHLLPQQIADTDELTIPLLAPDVSHAFCRFDLTEKNVLLTPLMPDATWALAIYTRYGENFYVITGAEAKRKELRLLLVPLERIARETATEKTEEGEDQIIVIAPSLTGIALLHAPVRGKSFLPSTQAALAAAGCEPQKETDAQRLAAGAENPSAAAEEPPEEPARRGRRERRQR